MSVAKPSVKANRILRKEHLFKGSLMRVRARPLRVRICKVTAKYLT
jgi:hypothetical protein